MTEEIQPDTGVPDMGVPQTPELSYIDRLGIPPWVYALIALGVIFLSYQVIGSIITLLIFGTSQITPENVQGIRLQTGLAQIFLMLVPTIILARLQTKDFRSLFSFTLPSWKSTLFALIGILALQQVLQTYLYFQDLLPLPQGIKPQIEEFRRMIEEIFRVLTKAHSVPELLFVIGIIALVPSICEELLFRGLVQKNFEKSSPRPWLGFVVTGTIFGVYHLNPFAVIPLIALGIYFGYIVYHSKSITIAIIGHFFNNTIAVVATYFGVDDEMVGTIATGNMTMPVIIGNLIVCMVILAGSTAAFHYSVKQEAGKG
jgi:membrane protease YdiL (CAAX protease family)